MGINIASAIKDKHLLEQFNAVQKIEDLEKCNKKIEEGLRWNIKEKGKATRYRDLLLSKGMTEKDPELDSVLWDRKYHTEQIVELEAALASNKKMIEQLRKEV